MQLIKGIPKITKAIHYPYPTVMTVLRLCPIDGRVRLHKLTEAYLVRLGSST